MKAPYRSMSPTYQRLQIWPLLQLYPSSEELPPEETPNFDDAIDSQERTVTMPEALPRHIVVPIRGVLLQRMFFCLDHGLFEGRMPSSGVTFPLRGSGSLSRKANGEESQLR